MNVINVITPNVINGIWQFDDIAKGLSKEPFVGKMNDIIYAMIDESIYIDKNKEISIFFAEEDFPGAEFVLTSVKRETTGMWYQWGNKKESMRGWLCPAVLKYFDHYPEKIYISLYTK